MRAEAQSDRVQFCIANSGPALSPKELAMMFEPFWQSAHEDSRGAGLGMSICRSIIEAHGGTIEALPEPGQRASIRFWLPLANPAAAAVRTPEVLPASAFSREKT